MQENKPAMRVDRQSRLADLVLSYPQILPLLTRFSITLGLGEKTIGQICSENAIHQDFFLEIVRSYSQPDHRPETGLDDFSITLIIDYLRHSHFEYIKVGLPRIEADIHRLISHCMPENKSKLARLGDYFDAYRETLIAHFRLEDEVLFPYAEDLEKAITLRSQAKIPTPPEKELLESQHEHLENSLTDLKNIIVRYLPPVRDQHTCMNILHQIFEMEKDLADHSRIEDRVLLPRMKKYEQWLATQ